MIYDPAVDPQRKLPLQVPIPPPLPAPRFPLADWGRRVYGFSLDGAPHLNLTVHLAPEGYAFRGICILCGHRHEILLDLRGLKEEVTPGPHLFAERVLGTGLSTWAADHSQCQTRPVALEMPAVVEAAHEVMVARAQEQLSRGDTPGRFVVLIYDDQSAEMLVPDVPEAEALFAAQELRISECLNAFARDLQRGGRVHVAACVQVHLPEFVLGKPQEYSAAVLIGTLTAEGAVVTQLPFGRHSAPGRVRRMPPIATAHPAFAGVVMKRTIDATQTH